MKQSKLVSLTILGAVAASMLAGCDDERTEEVEVQRCVDQNNIVVPDSFCQDPNIIASAPTNGESFLRTIILYHWLYGGNGGYSVGSRVGGGLSWPTPGMRAVRGSELQKNGYTTGGGHVGIIIIPGGGGTTVTHYSAPPSSRGGGWTSSSSSRGGFGSTGSGGGSGS